jgi:hypothetical protein
MPTVSRHSVVALQPATEGKTREARRKPVEAVSDAGPVRPDWWQWDLELSPHLLDRMPERGFTEIDLGGMLDRALGSVQGAWSGRWIISTRFRQEPWKVVVEPDPERRVLVVVTAYSAR